MTLDEWERLLAKELPDPGANLLQLGKQLVSDGDLSQADFENLIRHLGLRRYGLDLAGLLASGFEDRKVPDLAFWIDLILHARDDVLGTKVWSILIPYMDLSLLLLGLLARYEGATPPQRDRIIFAVDSMCRTTSIDVMTGDVMHGREHLDADRIVPALQKVMRLTPEQWHQKALKESLATVEGRRD